MAPKTIKHSTQMSRSVLFFLLFFYTLSYPKLFLLYVVTVHPLQTVSRSLWCLLLIMLILKPCI